MIPPHFGSMNHAKSRRSSRFMGPDFSLIEPSGHLFLCSFEMALLIQSLNMSLEIFVCAVCRFVAHDLRKEGSGTKRKKWLGGNEVLIRLDGCNRHR
jgi:hypothetical protein